MVARGPRARDELAVRACDEPAARARDAEHADTERDARPPREPYALIIQALTLDCDAAGPLES